MCINDMEKVQAMSLHYECLAMFVYAWVHGFNALWGFLIWRLILRPNRYEWMILNVQVMHMYDVRIYVY